MQQRNYRGFDICIHADRHGKEDCLVMTDISFGGLSWGRSQRTRFSGDFQKHEEEEMRAAMAIVDQWSGRRADEESRLHTERPTRSGGKDPLHRSN